MANEIVDSTVLEGRLTSIANSIRTKGGTTAKLDFYGGDYEKAVDAIKAGGFPNGTEWEENMEAPGPYNAVAEGNGVFVATSSVGASFSRDGKKFSNIAGISGAVKPACFGKGIWLVGGKNGLWQSKNAENWVKVSGDFNYTVSVCYGPGYFVASGKYGIAKSYDGVSWEAAAPQPESGPANNIKYADGVWCAMGSSTFLRSTDGINWAQTSSTIGKPKNLSYANGKWFGHTFSDVDWLGYFYVSDDANNWRLIGETTGDNANTIYTDRYWVTTANIDNYGGAYSSDGISWTPFQDPETSIAGEALHYADGVTVGTLVDKKIVYSVDGGKTWNRTNTFPSTRNTVSITHGKGIWVAVGQGVRYSVTWEP